MIFFKNDLKNILFNIRFMSNIKDIDNIIFNVEKISRTGKIVYIFIGNIEESLKKIVKKLENKESIRDKTELSKLKNNFKDEI